MTLQVLPSSLFVPVCIAPHTLGRAPKLPWFFACVQAWLRACVMFAALRSAQRPATWGPQLLWRTSEGKEAGGKGISPLLQAIAFKHPQQAKACSHGLKRIIAHYSVIPLHSTLQHNRFVDVVPHADPFLPSCVPIPCCAPGRGQAGARARVLTRAA